MSNSIAKSATKPLISTPEINLHFYPEIHHVSICLSPLQNLSLIITVLCHLRIKPVTSRTLSTQYSYPSHGSHLAAHFFLQSNFSNFSLMWTVVLDTRRVATAKAWTQMDLNRLSVPWLLGAVYFTDNFSPNSEVPRTSKLIL